MFKRDDDMVDCPYNKSHLMLRKRLQSHLLKCRIHYPDVELMKCPFNATHLVPEPEFTHHVTNCPDRKLITQYKYDAPVQKEEEIPSHAPVESEENWDDTDVPDYDPTTYSETATIIRMPEGPTPSERKEFIKKERKRLGEVDSEDDEQDGNVVQEISVSQAVPEYQNNESRRHKYDRNRRRRSRSTRSRSPNERNYSTSTSHRERRHRSRSPPTPPSPPIYSASSHRERCSYNLDNDPYYNQSVNRESSSNSRSKRHYK